MGPALPIGGEAICKRVKHDPETRTKEETSIFRKQATGEEFRYEESRDSLQNGMRCARIDDRGVITHSLRVGGGGVGKLAGGERWWLYVWAYGAPAPEMIT